MSDSDDLWARDPALMYREIGATVDKLYKRYHGLKRLPGWFDPTKHGVPFRSLLKGLARALKESNAVAFEEQLQRGMSSDRANEQATPSAAPMSHDQPLVSSVEDAKTIADLQAKVDHLQARLGAPGGDEHARLVELEKRNAALVTKKRVAADTNMKLKSEVAELRVTNDAYATLGSPEAIEGRVERLRAMISLAVQLYQATDSQCLQYEAILGPLVLSSERSERSLASFFAVLDPDGADYTLNDVARPLLPTLLNLTSSSTQFSSISDAIARESAGQSDSDTDRLPSSITRALNELVHFEPSIHPQLRSALFSRANISQAYDNMVSAMDRLTVQSMQVSRRLVPSALTPPTPKSSRRRLTVQDSEEDEEEDDVGSVASDPAWFSSTTKRPEPRRDVSGSFDPSRMHRVLFSSSLKTSAVGKNALIVTRKKAIEADAARRAASIRALPSGSRDGSLGWPSDPPTRIERHEIDTTYLRELPWRLGLLVDEQIAPVGTEYNKIVDDLRGHLLPISEVIEVYETRPWQVIATPPQPVVFSVPTQNRQLQAVYDNAVALYKHGAQVLWERTHFLLPDPSSSMVTDGKEYTGRDFLSERRSRNSKFTRYWIGHLEAIANLLLTPGIDADLSLDPFFYWPPPYGVYLAIPKSGQTIKDCIDAIDYLSPARFYFRGTDGAQAHATAFKLSETRLQAIYRKFDPPSAGGQSVGSRRTFENVSLSPADTAHPDVVVPPTKRQRDGENDATTSAANAIVDLSGSPVAIGTSHNTGDREGDVTMADPNETGNANEPPDDRTSDTARRGGPIVDRVEQAVSSDATPTAMSPPVI